MKVLAVVIALGLVVGGLYAADYYYRKDQASVMISECVQGKAAEARQQGKESYAMMVPYYRQMCFNELIASGDLVYTD